MSIHRLYGLYRHATDEEHRLGQSWYPVAHGEVNRIATRVGRDTRVIAGVIAALSPNVWWERCLQDSETMAVGHVAGRAIEDISVTTYNANRDKAWRILNGAEPKVILGNGPKVYAFFRNLIGDYTVPCIDSHAINAWHGRRVAGSNLRPRMRVTVIRKVTADYIRAARTQGVTPAEFQATIWVSWKRRVQEGKVPGYNRR